MSITEIIIPASTSNLGASFDACGLALSLYLKVRLEPSSTGFEVSTSGEGADKLPQDESNLIVRVARSVGELRGRKFEHGFRLSVENQIPLARGLGSSSAAIIAGISVYEALTGDNLTTDETFSYALRFEEHGDNLAPGLLGGLVVVCTIEGQSHERSLVTIKRNWPEELGIVLCVPAYEMDTARMRAVLPREITLTQAIFNLQRSALLQAVLSERRYDLLSEALRDRIHQPPRIHHGAGLADVLKLNDEVRDHPGLLGVSMSGAGSTMIAFAKARFSEIGAEMKRRFTTAGVDSEIFDVKVDNVGRRVQRIE